MLSHHASDVNDSRSTIRSIAILGSSGALLLASLAAGFLLGDRELGRMEEWFGRLMFAAVLLRHHVPCADRRRATRAAMDGRPLTRPAHNICRSHSFSRASPLNGDAMDRMLAKSQLRMMHMKVDVEKALQDQHQAQ